MKMDNPMSHQENSACWSVAYITALSSSVPRPEGKNQVGDEKYQ